MILSKRRPFRSRALLDAAKNQACVACGIDDGTIVAAHFSGKYSASLGKGCGQKASDHCCAHVCADCHRALDQYGDGNSDSRAIQFMLLIFETQRLLLERGILKVQ